MSHPASPSTMCAAFHRTVAGRPHDTATRTAGGPAYTWSEYAFALGRPRELLHIEDPGGDPEFDLTAAVAPISPDDLLTLVHTTGTMGRPKGVEITHANMVAMVQATVPLLGVNLDRVRVAITAAAPTPGEIIEVVNAIGVPLVEGWGMPEVSGLGAPVPPGTVRGGTIGRPVPGLEVRLLDDGELLVRGPMVTRGYRDQPEETAAAIDEHSEDGT